MTQLMKAIVLEGPNQVSMKEIPIPTPGPSEVLIRTKAGTICTSDIMDMELGLFSDNNAPVPMVMGHEGAGIISELGEGVTLLKVGDEVAVHPVIPCYICASCKRGFPHLCDNMGHLCFNKPGCFAEYFVIRQDRVRLLPPDMSFAVASLMEPVCVCLEAVNRGKVDENSRVLIAGDGPFGIMISKLCALKGAKQIIHTGFYDSRLSHSAGQPLNINSEPNLSAKIMQLTEGEGVDTAILCVSSPAAVDLCIEMLCSRGTMVVFSATNGKTPIDLMRVHLKELNIAGSNNDENYMDVAIKLLEDPALGLDKIITHELPFEEWKEGFRLASEGKENCLKVSLII